MAEVTQLLVAARQGDKKSAQQAFNLLYDDLRRMARSRLRQSQHFTLLDPTSLVHESIISRGSGIHTRRCHARVPHLSWGSWGA